MRGLSCYNNPNRLTGRAEAEGGGLAGGVEGKHGPIRGLLRLLEVGLTACAAL